VECLDANAVQDLMAGALEPPARSLAIRHLDGCGDCRGLISLLARDATRDAAVDTLRDTDKGTGVAVETVFSGEEPDPLAATAGPDEPAKVVTKTRIRPDHVGLKLGRFTIVERIGSGAMGIVFRADDPGLGRQVALKLLHHPDPALTERLMREARSMAQVSHPNVVTIYDVGVADDSTYIAMELVSGMSLRQWQQIQRPFAEVVEAYIAAGRGLAAAHAAGIIHRDFKPDNVLVGGDGRMRVTDFGLASARPTSDLAAESMSVSLDELSLTHSGMVLGTPAYMAPEQFAGGNVDPRTDQFNFCVALYEALYGQRPFKGKTFEELGDNVCSGVMRPVPPGRAVSGGLRAIVLRGLSVRPGDRYPSMDHLLVELGRDRARPWRRAAFAAAALAAALAIGLVADFAVRDRISDQIRDSFAATGKQVGRAFGFLTGRFDAAANQMTVHPALRAATSHRDQADFGLGTALQDHENLGRIHDELVSTDWRLWRKFGGKIYPIVFAVADYKGRMLYTSAAPDTFDPRAPVELTQIPWLRAREDQAVVLQRTSDPALAKTGLLGPAPGFKLGFFFTRTHVLAEEYSGSFVQALDARQLIDEIELDQQTRLSIVAFDGASVGDVPPALVAAAPPGDTAVEAEHDGVLYQVKSVPFTNFDGKPVGRVVMARELGGVLSLFPGARAVFAGTAFGALVLALLTYLRARRVAGVARS
jgi:hypothetical protein